jgi:WD40 repeat protein
VTIQDSPEGQTIVRLDANECQTLAAFPWSHEERRAGDALKDVSISRHGWLAVERWVGGYTVRETVVIDAAGTQQFVLPNASWAAWSPDGESLAYVSISEGLYMVDKANSQSRKLASGAHISSPSWSPDGQWLVYARPDSLDEEKSTIFKLQLETGAETTLFVGGTSPAWRMTQDSTK